MLKKFIYSAAAFALAVCAFAGCEKKEGPAAKDTIELSATEKTVSNEGGSFNVFVTSSSAWTLAPKETCAWVTPSITSGEDGDIVKFKVEPNTSDKNLTSVWVFTVGKASEELTVTSLAKPLAQLEADVESILIGYEKGEISLNVKAEAEYRDISVKVEGDWLKYITSLPGDGEYTAMIKFGYDEIEGLDDRTATITLSAEEAADVVIPVTQEALNVLSTSTKFYNIPVEGGAVEIPVTANVAYEIAVAQEGNWLSYEKTATGITFNAGALSEGKRAATVTLTQTDAREDEETLVYEFTLTQSFVLVNWAANMDGNRLFPKWDGGASALNYPEQLTLECLFKADNFNNAISTLMGIEGDFLLRLGDSAPKNVLQLATMAGNLDVYVDLDSRTGFEANTWYHVAVTLNQVKSGSDYICDVKVYINGELKGEKSNWKMQGGGTWYGDPRRQGITLNKTWSYEPDGNRCFWIGYAYDANRDLNGQMTEIRIWNKVLTEDDLKAENHFYDVDPKSEGLFSYWKFKKEGDGLTIADATGNGNPLYGETNVRKQGSDNKGDEGISWVEVALPDR